jgi:hypothetical protein
MHVGLALAGKAMKHPSSTSATSLRVQKHQDSTRVMKQQDFDRQDFKTSNHAQLQRNL